MKRVQNTLPIIVLLLGCPVAHANFEIMDAPVVKNYVSSNPGLETFTSYLEEVDSNSDGLPESISVAFNVYPTGSITPLFQTPLETFSYPKSPCVNAQSTSTNNDLKLNFAAPKTTILLRTTKITCQENGGFGTKAKYFGVVYASDLSGAGGNTWTKQFDQQIVATDVLVDLNGNQYNELSVTTSDNNGHLTAYLFDGLSGNLIKKPKTYVSGPVYQ